MRKLIPLIVILGVASGLSWADSTTLRLGLTKPATSFGDIWGAKLNDNYDLLDADVAGQSLYNTFTSTNAFYGQVYLSTSNITPGGYLTVNSSGALTTQSGGSGGSSSLGVGLGTSSGFTTQISSPTGAMTFSNAQFIGQLAGGATAFINLNPSTTYFVSTNPGAQQAAAVNVTNITVSTTTAAKISVSTLTVTSSGTLSNTTIAGPTLAYSSGTFLNSVAVGTSNVNGQPLRVIDTNGSGVASFESSTNTTLSVNLKNSTSGSSPNVVLSILGNSGDSATGGANGDALLRSANNLYLVSGGAASSRGLQISTNGVSHIYFSDGSTMTSAGASGNFIENTSTLQSGATFYVSSGTANSLHANVLSVAGTTSLGSTSNASVSISPFLDSINMTGSVAMSTVTASSGTVTNQLNIGNRLSLINFGDIDFGTNSPLYIFDIRGSSSHGDPTPLAYYQYAGNGIALEASATGNQPAFSAFNNASGYAIQASQAGGTSAALNAQTTTSTGAFITATSGTALLVKSTSGNAIQVDKGATAINGITSIIGVPTNTSSSLVYIEGNPNGISFPSSLYVNMNANASDTTDNAITGVITGISSKDSTAISGVCLQGGPCVGGRFKASGSGTNLAIDTTGGFTRLEDLTGSQFVKTDASKDLISYDLLNATQAWTGAQTFSSTITVVSIIGTGTPTVSTGTGAGTIGSPTASIAGKNMWGQLTVNSATTPATSSTVATITPSVAMPSKWVCVLFPANAVTALLSGSTMVTVDGTATNWTVTSGATGLTGSSTYVWDFSCGGY